MEFTIAMLQKLLSNPDETLSVAVKAAYNDTLYNFHGYVTYGVFMVRPTAVAADTDLH
jgi:hypothetical protein